MRLSLGFGLGPLRLTIPLSGGGGSGRPVKSEDQLRAERKQLYQDMRIARAEGISVREVRVRRYVTRFLVAFVVALPPLLAYNWLVVW